MNRSRASRYLLCLILVFGVLSSLLGGSVVLAVQEGGNGSFSLPPSQEEPPPEEEEELPPIEFRCKFPTMEGVAGDIFEFEVFIQPTSEEYTVKYDFIVIPPPRWRASVWAGYPARQVTSINFAGERPHSETITIKAAPTPGEMPEPGDYIITFELESEDIKESIELTAEITARYELSMVTTTGRLNTQAKVGEDNHLSVRLINLGTATLEDITFSSDKPEGWSITYNPDEIDSLEPGRSREVDVVIKPAEKTIAGDYTTTLRTNSRGNSETLSDSLNIRVTVVTPTIWGGVGIGIAVGVIASLVVLFRRLGRR